MPWADLVPNPNLVSWWEKEARAFERALVVGCGLGDDAAFLRDHGVGEVVAFDVSPTAVEQAAERFEGIAFEVADVLDLPERWCGAFDLVVEIYTLQVLPPELRARAATSIASTVATDGTLLVVARGRHDDDPPGEMPWPLVRDEIDLFGLDQVAFEDYLDGETRRFRVELRRL